MRFFSFQSSCIFKSSSWTTPTTTFKKSKPRGRSLKTPAENDGSPACWAGPPAAEPRIRHPYLQEAVPRPCYPQAAELPLFMCRLREGGGWVGMRHESWCEAVWAVGRGEAMCRGNHEADAWPSRHATNINVTHEEERPISTSGRCYSLEERLRSRGETTLQRRENTPGGGQSTHR